MTLTHLKSCKIECEIFDVIVIFLDQCPSKAGTFLAFAYISSHVVSIWVSKEHQSDSQALLLSMA